MAVKENSPLRPYQKDACLAMIAEAKAARELPAGSPPARALVIAPTGAGKTRIMLSTALTLLRKWGWKTIIMVPSKALVTQTVRAAYEITDEWKVGQIGNGKWECDDSHDLVVATTASLRPDRLREKGVGVGRFHLAMMDEAHHVASRSYSESLDYFSGARLQVGFTATFIRGDQKNIAESHFHKIISYTTISYLTERGYLVPAHGLYVHTGETIECAVGVGGDFKQDQLSVAVNTPRRNQLVVDSWLKFAGDRPSVVFCVDVEHSRQMAERFNACGVPARVVWGGGRSEYEEAMRAYNAGQVKVLCCALLLIEGWDAPHTAAVVIARPATKAASYVIGPQMVGRALRTHTASGKTDAVIIEIRDSVRVTSRPKPERAEGDGAQQQASGDGQPFEEQGGIIEAALGIPTGELDPTGNVPLHEQAKMAAERELERERTALRDMLLEGDEAEAEKMVTQAFSVIEKIAAVSTYAWVPLGSSLFMSLAGGDFIEVVQAGPSRWDVRAAQQSALRLLGSAPTRELAVGLADSWLDRNIEQNYATNRGARWREQKPTDPQVEYAASLSGLSDALLREFTRGQVSDIIATALALKNLTESHTLKNLAETGPRRQPPPAALTAPPPEPPPFYN